MSRLNNFTNDSKKFNIASCKNSQSRRHSMSQKLIDSSLNLYEKCSFCKNPSRKRRRSELIYHIYMQIILFCAFLSLFFLKTGMTTRIMMTDCSSLSWAK